MVSFTVREGTEPSGCRQGRQEQCRRSSAFAIQCLRVICRGFDTRVRRQIRNALRTFTAASVQTHIYRCKHCDGASDRSIASPNEPTMIACARANGRRCTSLRRPARCQPFSIGLAIRAERLLARRFGALFAAPADVARAARPQFVAGSAQQRCSAVGLGDATWRNEKKRSARARPLSIRVAIQARQRLSHGTTAHCVDAIGRVMTFASVSRARVMS
jgi:hypothetical protein